MATRHPSPRPGPPASRHRLSRRRRLAPLLALAVTAFGAGLLTGSRHEPDERRVAASFAAAWQRGD